MFTATRAQEQDIPGIVSLHRAELSESFNSRLGRDHLIRLYRFMRDREDSYVGVVVVEGLPVGVVSGTLDQKPLKSDLMRAMGLSGFLRIGGELLSHPSLFELMYREFRRTPPTNLTEHPVNACLTGLVVAPASRRSGVATVLVTALESFFRSQGVMCYWLDTLSSNTSARKFYRTRGFEEVCIRSGSVVFVKEITDDV